MSGITSYIVFRAAWRRCRTAKQAPPRSSCVRPRRCLRAISRISGSSAAWTRRPGGLAERDEADGGGDHVGAGGVQEGQRGRRPPPRHARRRVCRPRRHRAGARHASPGRARRRRRAQRPPPARCSPAAVPRSGHSAMPSAATSCAADARGGAGSRRTRARRGAACPPSRRTNSPRRAPGRLPPPIPARANRRSRRWERRGQPGEQAQEATRSAMIGAGFGIERRVYGSAVPPRPRTMSAIT